MAEHTQSLLVLEVEQGLLILVQEGKQLSSLLTEVLTNKSKESVKHRSAGSRKVGLLLMSVWRVVFHKPPFKTLGFDKNGQEFSHATACCPSSHN